MSTAPDFIAIETQILNLAKSDIRRAKKTGLIYVSDTDIGTVGVAYNATLKTFNIIRTKTGGMVYSGPAKGAAEALAGLYAIDHGLQVGPPKGGHLGTLPAKES